MAKKKEEVEDGVHSSEDVEGATEVQEEEFLPEPKPLDAAVDVSLGETVTVTLPAAAAAVLAQQEGAKLAELNDAKALLREQL